MFQKLAQKFARGFDRKLKKRRALPGLSIVEVLVYLALFGLIFYSVVVFMISIKDSNRMALDRTDMEKTALYLMNHMNSSFNIANSITADANTVYNSDNGKIKLILPTKYAQYSLTGSALHFNDNGTDYNITNPDYTISKFYLEQVFNNDNVLVGVRLTMTIVSAKTPQITKTINTSFIL